MDLEEGLRRYAQLHESARRAVNEGTAPIALLREAAEVRSLLSAGNASSFTQAQARALYEKVLRLPVRT